MIEGTICPACNTHLLIEIGAEIEGKMFEFPSGIKLDFSEARCGIRNVWTKREKFDRIKRYLYQKLLSHPVYKQHLMECLVHRCKLNESLANDLIEEIKIDFGAYERNNMIMFA